MKNFSVIRILSILLVLSVFVSMFAINASAATVSESESNNDFGSADTLTLGNTMKGKLDNSDVDYYKMVASSNGKINIKFNHAYADVSYGWYVEIYTYSDGEYKELSCSIVRIRDVEGFNLPTIGANSSKAYYIKVSNYGNAVGREYQIVSTFTSTAYYEKEFNNDYGTATAISLGNTYGGNINSSSDADYYKITSSSNGKVNLKFNHTYADVSYGWTIEIYIYKNSEYKELTYQNIYIRDVEKSIPLPTIGAVPSGTYYIKVSNNGNAEGREYSITTSFTSTNYYEKELNNDYGTATAVSLGSTYGGNMNLGSDVDYYKITSTSNGKINLKFNHTYADVSYGWYIEVLTYKDTKYSQLFYKYVYIRDSESVDLPAIEANSSGIYYIKVSNNGNAEGREYSISIGGTTPVTNYTVTYNANGGSVSPKSKSVQPGESVTLPTPTKNYTISYKTFFGDGEPDNQSVSVGCKGWSTSSSATSASYSCGSSYKPSSSTTLYAVWNSSASAKLSTVTPTRKGYKFLGWSTKSTGSDVSYSAGASVSLTGDLKLYAVWGKDNSGNDDPNPTPTPTNNDTNFFEWLYGVVLDSILSLFAIVTFPFWIWFVL
ncbi:MAG: InlB B-repeat-containing protein [Clostridia bacterium]|nr:InlB B-repeat-containing protein [Clostridia bacterium]